jgi:hypothetical protein
VPADPAPSDLVRGLVSAVNPVPGIVWRPAEVFRPHLARVKTWRPSESIDPPRTLGLPAPLTLAAENMHEGNGRAASNNCGRLASRLDLTHEQTDRCTCANRGSTKQTPTRCAIVAASDATHGACRPTDGAAWRFLRRLRNAVEKGFAGLRARGFAPLGAE